MYGLNAASLNALLISVPCCMKQGHVASLKVATVEVWTPQKSENAMNLACCIVLLFSTLQKMGGGKVSYTG